MLKLLRLPMYPFRLTSIRYSSVIDTTERNLSFSCRAQWDPFQALLQGAKQINLPDAGSKYNPIPGLLSASPQKRGKQDPLGNAIRHANLPRSKKSKYDPTLQLLDSTPQQRGVNDALGSVIRKADLPDTRDSKYDPVLDLLHTSPQEKGQNDGLGNVLSRVSLPRNSDSKYNPVAAVLGAEPQKRGENDPFGSLIRQLTHADYSHVPGESASASETKESSLLYLLQPIGSNPSWCRM